MIAKMAIARALRGFNDLGRSVNPTFLSRNRFYSQLSTHYPKLNKTERGKSKKFKISVHWTSNPAIFQLQVCVKLWSINSKLFFKEPH